MDYLLLVFGLVLLILGAEGLVKGAARLAANIGIPSLVIGLTVVAFGTSAPELAVSMNSALANKTELAIANVVGSNIFNVLFILGLAALITPLAISKQLIRQDVPIMVLASALVFYMATDGLLSVWECGLLVVLLVGYTTFLFVQGKRADSVAVDTNDDEVSSLTTGHHPVWQSTLWLVAGLVLLIIGANLLVNSAVTIARTFAVSEAIIGLTILAIGTSLPEVVTSIVASFKGQRDIAVGNVIGSNVFNLLAVLGISGLFSSEGLLGNTQLIEQDFPIMLGVALLCAPLMLTGAVLNRIEGMLFFGLYLLYTAFLIGGVKDATWLSPLSMVTWNIIFPVTLIVIVVSLIKHWWQQKQLKS
ncbi:calcium/sodium antiporter [Alteromonas sp. ASW11-130]|uniref:calcium/sodium antiporter n=1 Tax=Alteromonas sp. ASW11-130 TaxID=3015775 RepID=UPI002242BE3B|nr:calcium/sodium antiporter [Alteromonas sp. ASW11-130]MCW8092245.1 calcium/sodium antiporter [Alteromonas sp. ASW11-130]